MDRISHIAILYQDDAFGRAGLLGTQRALARRGMELVSEGTFERNTIAVKRAALMIRAGNPQAVIMIGAYRPCAAFIKLARQLKMPALFLNVSFVGSNSLAKELGSEGDGVIVTQVVPFPSSNTIPLSVQYQAALRALNSNDQAGFVSLEGYLVGRLVIAALERISGPLTRRTFLNTLSSGSFDLGGVTLSYAPGKNQGGDSVYLTVLRSDGTFESLETLKARPGMVRTSNRIVRQ